MGLIKIEIVCKFGTLKFEMNDYKNKEAFYFLLVNHIKIHSIIIALFHLAYFVEIN